MRSGFVNTQLFSFNRIDNLDAHDEINPDDILASA
jgi:hypothetical protein